MLLVKTSQRGVDHDRQRPLRRLGKRPQDRDREQLLLTRRETLLRQLGLVPADDPDAEAVAVDSDLAQELPLSGEPVEVPGGLKLDLLQAAELGLLAICAQEPNRSVG